MILAFAGLLAGVTHALSGPDHLTAIAPLVARNYKTAWTTGVRWGIGHATGILIVGCLAMFFREILPVNLVSSMFERLVGVVLIGIGLWAIKSALSTKLHLHEHTHEDESHIHFHCHSPRETHDSPSSHVHRHTAFGIGTLHGLAGGSHLVGVLPALALPSSATAAIYICSFGLGTFIAIVVFSSCFGFLARRSSSSGLRHYRLLLGASGGAAMVVGFCWTLL